MAKKPEKLKRVVNKVVKEKVEKVVAKEEETPARLSHTDTPVADVVEDDEVVDYLQQYQYKKVNNIPTIGGPLTNPDFGSKAERMKKSLLLQRRVSVLVTLEPGSDPKVPASVTLNGYRLDLPTNTYVEVPEQVAQIIMDSQSQTVAALNRDRIENNSKMGANNAF